jgi:hypothetical protein
MNLFSENIETPTESDRDESEGSSGLSSSENAASPAVGGSDESEMAHQNFGIGSMYHLNPASI